MIENWRESPRMKRDSGTKCKNICNNNTAPSFSVLPSGLCRGVCGYHNNQTLRREQKNPGVGLSDEKRPRAKKKKKKKAHIEGAGV